MEEMPRRSPISSSSTPSTDSNPSQSCVRLLVVDDYEPFRRFICSTLGKKSSLRIVGEASDGLQAVHKANELQPDLIVLDIGLPNLNGIEAARRIRKVSPECKILFVSQESSTEVVQEALSLGALGYVVKAHAASELIAAVEAVSQGKQFVGRAISGRDYSSVIDARNPDSLFPQNVSPSPASPKADRERSHTVEFYPDDAGFVAGFARFTQAALDAGKAVLVVVTESHQRSLFQKLQEHGVDPLAAIESGRLIPLDVTDTLFTFMGNDLMENDLTENDLPDPLRFSRVVGDLIAAAARATAGKHSRVAICGECASILWAQGKADGAIQVEQLCNQLTKRYEIDILCGFSLSSFYREEDKQVFQRICSEY